MLKFRPIENGYVIDTLTDGDIAVLNEQLKTYLKLSEDFNYQKDPLIVQQLLRNVKKFIGPSFSDWLLANHNGGIGPRAPLVLAILSSLNGVCSGRVVRDRIGLDYRTYLSFNDNGTKVKIAPQTGRYQSIADSVNELNNLSLLRLVEIVGYRRIARMMVSFGGGNNRGRI